MQPTVTMVGNLTRDTSAIFANPDGSAKRCLFSVACNHSYTKDDNKVKQVDFIPCIAWNKLADVMQEWGLKGRRVQIQGVLEAFQKPVNDDGSYDPVKVQVKVERIEFVNFEDNAREKAEAEKAAQTTQSTSTGQPAITQEALLGALAKLLTGTVPTTPTEDPVF